MTAALERYLKRCPECDLPWAEYSPTGWYLCAEHRWFKPDDLIRLARSKDDGVEVATGKDRLRLGGDALFEVIEMTDPYWGSDDDVLGERGEPMLIYGPTGIGKGTLAQNLVGASIRVLPPDVLGLRVAEFLRVLYIAADRPKQAKRSFRRMVTAEHRGLLNERLRIHEGPLPFDVGEQPEELLTLALGIEAELVVIDSLKDVAAGLEKPEVGQRVNRAMQLLVAQGIEVIVLHHPRKATPDNKKPTAIDDLFGSRFLADGCGSVVLLWGAPGDAVFELNHLKQPREQVGPWAVVHDKETGGLAIEERVDTFTVIAAANGINAEGIARAIFSTDKPSRSQVENARQRAERLASKGYASRHDGGKAANGKPTTYYFATTKRTAESSNGPAMPQQGIQQGQQGRPNLDSKTQQGTIQGNQESSKFPAPSLEGETLLDGDKCTCGEPADRFDAELRPLCAVCAVEVAEVTL